MCEDDVVQNNFSGHHLLSRSSHRSNLIQLDVSSDHSTLLHQDGNEKSLLSHFFGLVFSIFVYSEKATSAVFIKPKGLSLVRHCNCHCVH